MLRRHSWLKPASTSSSVRACDRPEASGTWKTYRGWTSPKPPSTACWRQPSSRSRATVRAPAAVSTRDRRATSPSAAHGRGGDGVLDGAAPATGGATTGGPILHARSTAAPRRCASIGEPVEPRRRRSAPVEDRALWQVGEVALQPAGLAVAAPARRPRASSPSNQPRLLAAPLAPSPRPRPGSAGSDPLAAVTKARCSAAEIGRTARGALTAVSLRKAPASRAPPLAARTPS